MGVLFARLDPSRAGLMGSKEDGMSGIPIRTVAFRDGNPKWVSEVREVKKEDFKASLFEIPKGFARKRIGTAPPGSGGP
jgi:hypothetical protein